MALGRGTRMKCTLWAMLSLPFAAAYPFQQTPVKSQPAQKSSGSLMTDQEKNIRAYTELLRSDIRKNKTQIVGLVIGGLAGGGVGAGIGALAGAAGGTILAKGQPHVNVA